VSLKYCISLSQIHRAVEYTTITPTHGKKNRHIYPFPTHKPIIHILYSNTFIFQAIEKISANFSKDAEQ
jgi:hypothetical protein